MFQFFISPLIRFWDVLRGFASQSSLFRDGKRQRKDKIGNSPFEPRRDFYCTPNSDASDGVETDTASDEDRFWFVTLGSALSTLMDAAGYEVQVQERGMQFFEKHVEPFMGRAPTDTSPPHWKSFMTDDFSPVEYSWTWEPSPKIRYSFEPVGRLAGTRSDPFNRDEPLACVELMRQAMPDSDWKLFERLASQFHTENRDGLGSVTSRGDGASDPSSIMLAVEIGKRGAMAKAYLVPVRAEQTGKSRFDVLAQGLQDLQETLLQLPAYLPMIRYIEQVQSTTPFQLIGVAVDCVEPQLAKLKIYLRSQRTCFNDVWSTLTMHGLLHTWDESVRAELWELWRLVLGLSPDFDPQDGLPRASHETGGILYNFDIQANNALPDTKLYIPVKHYGKNDAEILEGLTTWLKDRGQGGHTDAFAEALKAMTTSYRTLDDGRGLQTYIACAVEKGRLQLTSYMSAEIYHVGRWT